MFIDPKSARPNITSLCLTGSQLAVAVAADLDKRLSAICFRQETSYGGEIGLRQAVSRTDLLGETAAHEIRVLERFFELVRAEPERIACGLKETLFALKAGAVEALLLHEESTQLHPDYADEQLSLLDFFLCDEDNFQGAELQLIRGFDNNGSMFIKGFDGFSAILRYRFDCSSVHDDSQDLDSSHDDSDHEESDEAEHAIKSSSSSSSSSSAFKKSAAHTTGSSPKFAC